MADRRDRREDNFRDKDSKSEKDKDIRDTRQDLRKDLPRKSDGGFGGRNREDRRFNNEPYGRGGFNKRRNDRNQFKVDRKKTCPFLLRVFPETGKHHELSEYTSGSVPAGEIAIYTWKDTSLRELTELILPALKLEKDSASLEFSFIFPEPTSGELSMRTVGTVGKAQGPDDQKTFADLQFNTGDFLDVCVRPLPSLNKVS